MASVNLCDRPGGCKSMVRGRALGSVTYVTSSEPGAERRDYELCPGCIADVLSLLETAPTTDRLPAYSEPFRRAPEPSEEDVVVDAFEAAVERVLDRRERKTAAIEGSSRDQAGT